MATIKQVRIQMNHSGSRDLLMSDEVLAECERRADKIAAAAGGEPDFIVLSGRGSARAFAIVITSTIQAKLAEARTRDLSNSLNAGRG